LRRRNYLRAQLPLRVLGGGGLGESEQRAKDDGQFLEVHGAEGGRRKAGSIQGNTRGRDFSFDLRETVLPISPCCD
jgi:hypothetical protein